MSILCLTPRRTQPSFALQIQLFHPFKPHAFSLAGTSLPKCLAGTSLPKAGGKGEGKKTFLGEKSCLKFFLFFWLGPNGKWEKNFLGCEKFIFSPRHSTFQTRKSCSSRNKGLHFLLRTGSNNHKHGQQLQENELSAKLLQNHSLPKKTFQLQKSFFPCPLPWKRCLSTHLVWLNLVKPPR